VRVARSAVSGGLATALAGAVVHTTAAGGIVIRNVDTSDYPTVRVTAVTPTATRPPALTENGRRVRDVEAENLGQEQAIVLALDHSQSMGTKPLADAVVAASTFVDAKPESNQIAVVLFASKAVSLTGFSASTTDADDALSGLSMDRVYGTALYDAVVVAARKLRDHGLPGRTVILVSDGQETTSTSTLRGAVRAARRARAAVYTVAIPSKAFEPARMKALARRTGGGFYQAPSSGALTAIYRRIGAELERTWRLEYVTAGRPGDVLRLGVRSRRDAASVSARLPGEPARSTGSRPSGVLVGLAVVIGAVVIGVALWPVFVKTVRR
jgi:VWFA-related protein